MKIKVLELFAGIGAVSKALERLNIDFEIVDAVEIDKYAIKSFNAVHGTNFESQDITKWDKDIEVDLISHGSPCQDFSLAGKQAGGDKDSGTRSSLMYETIRIVEKLKPKYVIWENVKNLLSKKHRHNFDAYLETMEQLGYTNYYQVLNAKDYGIPQNRERVFTVSILDNHTEKDEKISLLVKDFKFPEKQELKLKLKDMLEDEVDEKYYLSDKMVEYISADNEKWTGNNDKSIINKSVASAINTGEGSRRCDASNYISNQVEENFNLKIKNNTKKGYLEAVEGDGVDVSGRMQWHRGTVQKQMIQTLNTNQDYGVVVKDIRNMKEKLCDELVESGLLNDGTVINHSYTNGLCGKNKNSRQTLEDYIESNNGVMPCVTTRPDTMGIAVGGTKLQREVCNKAIEKNLVEPNDVIEYTYSNARLKEIDNNTIRKQNKADNQIMSTLVTKPDKLGVVVKSVYSDLEEQLFTEDGNIKRYIDSDIVDEFKEGQMATTSFPNGYGHGPRTHDESICLNCIDKPSVKHNLRIRKLTPKECWRLMGFDDEDFEKASKVNSNSQLYKQAGNSIVVNVLENIFKELFKEV